MSGIICTCGIAAKNLGLPGCTDLAKIPRRLIFVPTFQEDGTLNYIDTTTFAFTQAAWDALQYATEVNERYYPLPVDIEEVKMEKTDTVYQTFASGNKKVVRDGDRSFEGFIPTIAIPIIGKLKSKGCAKHSVFIVDNEGNIIGQEKSLGKLYPLQLADNTLNAIFQFATDTTVSGVKLMMQFAQNVADEEISMIAAGDLGTGVDMFTTFNGKQDTNISQVAGNRSTTTFRVKIYSDYGTANTKLPVSGLVTADFTVYNVTDSTSKTLTSATEVTGTDGTYDFVLSAAETASDIIRLGLSTSVAAKPFAADSWYDVQIALQ